MDMAKNLAAGLVGALALNIIHETVRQIDPEAPRVQLIGEEALTKVFKSLDIEPPEGDNLYLATLATDVISNALYYSMIGLGDYNEYLLERGALHGAVAGIGALVLTKPMGLNDEPVNRTTRTKVLTVAWYTLGGLVTGLVLKRLKKS